MTLSDADLAHWGNYGRQVTLSSTALSPSSFGPDIVTMWNVIGTLEQKVRELSEQK